MQPSLRILIVEDSLDDAELIIRELRRAGFIPEWRRVDTEEDYAASLHPDLDIILCDYKLPGFSGPRALEVIRERGLDIPVIIVSGAIGEETAVATIKQGAVDYLMKDRLARLRPAIERALALKMDVTERKRVEEALRLFRTLVDQSNDIFEVIDPETARFLDVNEKGPAELGCSREEYLSLRVSDIDPSFPEPHWLQWVKKMRATGSQTGEGLRRRKDGTTFPIEVNAKWICLDRDYIVAVVRNITERKRAEEAAVQLAAIVESSEDGIIGKDLSGTIISWNLGAEKIFGYPASEMIGQSITRLIAPERQIEEEMILARIGRGENVRHFETMRLRKDGSTIAVSVTVSAVRNPVGIIVGASKVVRDITACKRRELNLAFLAEMQKIFAPRSSAREIMRLASKRIAEHMGLAHCLLLEINEAADQATVLYDHPAADASSLAGDYRIRDFHTEEERREMLAGRTVAIADVRRNPRSAAKAEQFIALGIGALANASYVTEGSCKFVLSALRSEPKEWPQEDTELLTELVERIYLWIERARAEEQLRERTSQLRSAVEALEARIFEGKQLEQEILAISECEQRRLGQDLHDGLGQELAGIALLGLVLANKLEAESHPSAKDASDISNYIHEALGSARRLASGLYPIELSRFGLLLALEILANQTHQRLGICCELRQSGDAPRIVKSAEIHLYRIVQECIGNAIKHGQARHITIESHVSADMHTFTVTNDGIGFEKPAGRSGMGLDLMNYRARVVGAEIDIRKPAEGGCQVTCQLRAQLSKERDTQREESLGITDPTDPMS